ncbi:hypothetical protein VNO77_33298 [Canavalia gladiata]|uniref:Pentatricopeptide repeat-containing protein n=1 Tax=Canavalia gladiata TaxID=3824 RepID=A0AAN9KBI3_CANGL
MLLSFSRFRFLSSSFFLSFNPHSTIHSRSYSHFIPNPDDAVSLFNSMLHKRPIPPVFEFNQILGSLAKTKNYNIAISLSKRMEFRGIERDIFTLNILLNCFCQLHQMRFTFSVLGKIFKMGHQPDTVTMTTLMRGRIAYAWELFDEMHNRGL